MRVLLFGTFDCLHPGHEFLLMQALEHGEVFVIIARDSHVQQIKGRRPQQAEEVRRDALQRRFPQVTALLGHESDFLHHVRTLNPDLILLGYDQLLPPGVSDADIDIPTKRLSAHEPHRHKSSLRRRREH